MCPRTKRHHRRSDVSGAYEPTSAGVGRERWNRVVVEQRDGGTVTSTKMSGTEETYVSPPPGSYSLDDWLTPRLLDSPTSVSRSEISRRSHREGREETGGHHP